MNINTANDQISDLSLIAVYPREYAEEALLLIRRLEYLKLQVKNVSTSQIYALADVQTMERLIEQLYYIDIKHRDGSLIGSYQDDDTVEDDNV